METLSGLFISLLSDYFKTVKALFFTMKFKCAIVFVHDFWAYVGIFETLELYLRKEKLVSGGFSASAVMSFLLICAPKENECFICEDGAGDNRS